MSNLQRKTKGQQLKGKIVSALFHTFWQFSTHFHTFSEFFRIFPPRLFFRIKGFYWCFSPKIRKEKKKENKKKKTKPFCTLVVARLSSSEIWRSAICLPSSLISVFFFSVAGLDEIATRESCKVCVTSSEVEMSSNRQHLTPLKGICRWEGKHGPLWQKRVSPSFTGFFRSKGRKHSL